MSKSTTISNVPATKDALLKSYRKRLRDDIQSMTSNFTEIVKLLKVEEESQVSRATQCEEDAFEMQVRAANMVRKVFLSYILSNLLSRLQVMILPPFLFPFLWF